ncbi:MAG: DUF5808 domain-containing protein [Collinsella sp.]|nr:DUF5808 domain-containing protein [Collinsella sp.]
MVFLNGSVAPTTAPMHIVLIAFVLLTGALTAAMPWLMQPGECFAVTIPPSQDGSPRLRGLKRSYSLLMGLVALGLAGFSLACLPLGEDAFALAASASVVLLSLASFLVMLAFRGRVQEIKRSSGWVAGARIHVAALGEVDLPEPVSLRWELVHVLFLVVAATLMAMVYPGLPDRVAIHFDMQGNANGWVDKGPELFIFVLGTIAFLGLCLTVSHVAIVGSKRSSRADAPATSLYGYAVYARAQSILLVGLGTVMNGLLALMPLVVAGSLSVEGWTMAMLAFAFVCVAASIAMAVLYGQNGNRVVSRVAAAGNRMLADDDEFWKGGIFYVNRDDAAVFVPKRFGIGWTLNLGRPAAWGVVALVAISSAAFVIAMASM